MPVSVMPSSVLGDMLIVHMVRSVEMVWASLLYGAPVGPVSIGLRYWIVGGAWEEVSIIVVSRLPFWLVSPLALGLLVLSLLASCFLRSMDQLL